MKRMCWPCCLQALESLLLRLHVALSRINFTKWLSLCSFSLKSITFDQTEEARPLDLQHWKSKIQNPRMFENLPRLLNILFYRILFVFLCHLWDGPFPGMKHAASLHMYTSVYLSLQLIIRKLRACGEILEA